ncbi:MAG: hypothetical protein AVDCRST_MAG13-2266 [uncultured Solirubrobacteraceae bacterium]|uniref:Uncharacterized protein n=1 Tax=uncultured Solirubrobacteraceae bacterium TaxID=1162706 RepID=A0A6J4SJY5_9ACTN|nr:MAG: hypothetical protein AVDCRST_MAG13-2266 [uncultured Solirubrobacteraceae bacterium]
MIARMLDSADTGARGARFTGIERPNEVEPSIEMLFRHVGAQGEAIRLLAREVQDLRAACAVGRADD